MIEAIALQYAAGLLCFHIDLPIATPAPPDSNDSLIEVNSASGVPFPGPPRIITGANTDDVNLAKLSLSPVY